MGMEFLHRRIKWRQSQCTAELVGEARCLFAWSSKAYEYNDALKEWIPLEAEEWGLYADGVPEDKFRSEEELKCFIIRFTYDIREWMLIPSELLHDAGLVYVTNEWIDSWIQPGRIKVESRDPLPRKPKIRSIRLPGPIEVPSILRKREKVHDDHRTSVLRLVPRNTKPAIHKPYEPRRLQKGDNLELTYQEETEVWLADQMGCGLDEFDTYNDDECYYVLETGECDAETCATITIDPETPEGEEGTSQVQATRETEPAEEVELHENDHHRFG